MPSTASRSCRHHIHRPRTRHRWGTASSRCTLRTRHRRRPATTGTASLVRRVRRRRPRRLDPAGIGRSTCTLRKHPPRTLVPHCSRYRQRRRRIYPVRTLLRSRTESCWCSSDKLPRRRHRPRRTEIRLCRPRICQQYMPAPHCTDCLRCTRRIRPPRRRRPVSNIRHSTRKARTSQPHRSAGSCIARWLSMEGTPPPGRLHRWDTLHSSCTPPCRRRPRSFRRLGTGRSTRRRRRYPPRTPCRRSSLQDGQAPCTAARDPCWTGRPTPNCRSRPCM